MLIHVVPGDRIVQGRVHNESASMMLMSANRPPMDALMHHDEEIERASRALKAMSHPLRLKILCTLGDQ